MASFCGEQIDMDLGSYFLKMHGQIYHRIITIGKPSKSIPGYSQLYLLDQFQANEHRLNRTNTLSPKDLKVLSEYVHSKN
jgi:hypothetical protein